jgi:hypothetical protein
MSITIESLSQQITTMEARLEALESQKSKPSKGLKASKAPKDPNAPKKEANWFVQSLANIRSTLAPLIDTHNSGLPEGGKKITGVCATQVGRILKEDGLMTKILQPTEAQIKAAFQTFLHTPLPVKTEEWKAAGLSRKDSAASSVSSAEKPSKASPKPKAVVSPEDKEAKKAAKAAKAAATRAANKAKKNQVQEPEEEVEDSEVIETEEVTMDIGKGGSKLYERIIHNGVTYIYTADGENFLGEWNEATKKLNPNGKDIKNA